MNELEKNLVINLTPKLLREFKNGNFNKKIIDEAYKEFKKDSKEPTFVLEYLTLFNSVDMLSIKDLIKLLFFMVAKDDTSIYYLKLDSKDFVNIF